MQVLQVEGSWEVEVNTNVCYLPEGKFFQVGSSWDHSICGALLHAEMGIECENQFRTTWEMLTITNNMVTSRSKQSGESFHQCLFKKLSDEFESKQPTYKNPC